MNVTLPKLIEWLEKLNPELVLEHGFDDYMSIIRNGFGIDEYFIKFSYARLSKVSTMLKVAKDTFEIVKGYPEFFDEATKNHLPMLICIGDFRGNKVNILDDINLERMFKTLRNSQEVDLRAKHNYRKPDYNYCGNCIHFNKAWCNVINSLVNPNSICDEHSRVKHKDEAWTL